MCLAALCPLAKAAANLNDALASQGDLWGDQAIQQPGGPTYTFFEKLLPPLRYVNTSYREYPLVLSAPLAETKVRLISNGSAVNIPLQAEQGGNWFGYPVGLTFHVNDSDEIFGQDHARLTGPSFERGYLPIVHTAYQTGQQSIDEECFVPTESPWSDHGVAFIKFSTAQKTAAITAAFDSSVPLHLQGNSLCNGKDQTFVLLSDDWKYDGEHHRLSGTIAPQKPLLLAIFTKPLSAPPLAFDTYDQLRARCISEWEKWLTRCAQLDVPEEIVNRAWKSSIIANLMIAAGDKMYYSAGNVYRNMWVAENGDSVHAMAAYGLFDTGKAMLGPILQIHQQGLDYHNAGFKLQLLASIYWLTRDPSLVEKYRPLWQPEVDLILNHREKENGLLPREQYCGDINTPVYSLNSNANSWKGLHDIAAVLDDMGRHDEASRIAHAASDFHTAILAAIAKSERTDVKPAFIPVALFGEEKPYDVLTATRMGTYWILLIPYILGSDILDEPRTTAVLDYLQTRGALCMGMLRIHQHSGLFANENGLDDGYTSRYFQAIAQRDQVDRMLVSFYGKLAQGFTRNTFVGAEGSSLVSLDPGGRPMYLPPNTTSNAFFLMMLRTLLVQDELGESGSGKLKLLFATPRAWLEDGKTIDAQNIPTNFGPVSIKAHSDLSHGQVTVEVSPPPRAAKSMELRLRLPERWNITAASIGDEKLSLAPNGAFDISSHHKPFRLLVTVAQTLSSAPPRFYPDHFNLMQYMDEQGQMHPVKTPEDWQHRRQDILLAMQQVMGDLPPRDHLHPLDVQISERFTGDGFERLKITYIADKQERIPAYLFIPTAKVSGKKYPAILALHQTTPEGKKEPAGLAGSMPYALELAKRGYIVVCPDYPTFGEYPYDFHNPDYHFASGTMKGIFNHMRAVDLLVQRPDVDASNIGVIGHSLGGHNALFVAAFDTRIKAVVTSCGWTPFPNYYAGNLKGWTQDRYMPRIRDVYHSSAAELPFDFPELIAAIAPRAVLSISPLQDANFDVNGVKKAIPQIEKVYKLLGAPDALHVIYPPGPHGFPPDNRQKAYEFLDAHLK